LPAERRVLVDTNVVSYPGDRKGRQAEWAEVVRDREAFVSFVTVGEILAGGISAGWGEVRMRDWEDRLRAYTVIPGTIDVARQFARLYARFRHQVGDDDLWIAATALADGSLPIATNDGFFDTIAQEFPLELLRPMPTRE
jgi:predicted nucleic acid-binding protein